MRVRIIGWVGIGLAVVVVGSVAATWLSTGFDEAQANSDRQTVDCLTNRLTAGDRASIAQSADRNDLDALWRVYDQYFPDCAVRGDQRDRKVELEGSAWRTLQADPDFARLRESNAAMAAGSH
jgi:hypothetical protein